MSNFGIELSEQELAEIRALAAEVRREMGIAEDVPAAKELRRFLEKKNIYLCEYPFSGSNDTHLDATITRFEGDYPMIFIGLNTSLYYDEQIFALAHELYHYYTKTGKAYDQEMTQEYLRHERKADRFAAELLLPREALERRVYREFPEGTVDDASWNRLLRFIGALHAEWWITYRSTVNRLYEENFIKSDGVYQKLYGVDARDENGEYIRLMNGLHRDTIGLLNRQTRQSNVSEGILECILENYEEERISEDSFVGLLRLIGKKPEDLGYLSITAEPDDDLKAFLEDDPHEG